MQVSTHVQAQDEDNKDIFAVTDFDPEHDCSADQHRGGPQQDVPDDPAFFLYLFALHLYIRFVPRALINRLHHISEDKERDGAAKDDEKCGSQRDRMLNFSLFQVLIMIPLAATTGINYWFGCLYFHNHLLFIIIH